MTFFALLRRNLLYHWRGNLAVLLGIIVGTAVLTGALFVGDSLRGSLEARALEQLGWVEHALISKRFFREKLVDSLPGAAAPVILLQGNAQTDAKRANRVTIFGMDSRFLAGVKAPDADLKEPAAEVVLNTELARLLNVKAGDKVTLNVHKADNIPRESLLGKRKAEDVAEPMELTVKSVLPDGSRMANFSLKPTPEPVRNAFVPLKYLQSRLNTEERVNAVLAAGRASILNREVQEHLTMEDWNLRLRGPDERAQAFFKYLDPRGRGALTRVRWQGRVPDELAALAEKNGGQLTVELVTDFYRRRRSYWSLESAQMFLEPHVVRAADKVAETHLKPEHILVYLADKITDGKEEIPYAVVAATMPSLYAPLELKDDEIALVDWPGSPLKNKAGDKITVEYYSPDAQGALKLLSKTFTLKGTLPLEGVRDDPDLTPEFPGITDKLDMASWENPPFPYSAKRVKPRDEEYWKRYRATPKAYVNLATGQRLWGTRFGKLTSIKLSREPVIHSMVGQPGEPVIAKPSPLRLFPSSLDPEQGGFVFDSVKQRNLASSGGATDFGVLFLAFSFFLIAAALLLIGLLFRLNLDRRAREIGLLLAVGMRRGKIRLLLLSEGILLAIVGGLVGLAGAMLYASMMLDLLRARWPGEQNLFFLDVHVRPTSFLIGYVSAIGVTFMTIVWATRVLSKVVPRSLLAGQTTDDGLPFRARNWSGGISILSLLGAAVCLVLGTLADNHDLKAGGFFGSGALLLTAGLAGALWSMRSSRKALVTQGGAAVSRLGMRNASRHVARSLLTAGLLASATFLVVAVEVFHKDAGADFHHHTGGSGGFSLFAESDLPIFQSLTDPKGWPAALLTPETQEALKETKVFPFRVRAGDDASCLNLYQPLKPKIFGVPKSLIDVGGFRITPCLTVNPDAWSLPKGNIWPVLEGEPVEGIPAFVDANSAQWILKVGLGDTFEIEDDQGQKVKLQIVGLLHESIFQSEVLIADRHFVKLFPRQEGFQFFLVDDRAGTLQVIMEQASHAVKTKQAVRYEPQPRIKRILEQGFATQGLTVLPTADRLRAYLAVENMYLAVFQALGGLGLVLGALGLGVVLVRSVWERRGELALLRALGFRQRVLGWLVLAENVFLLALGLSVGTASALVAVAPHLIGTGSAIQWQRLVLLLLAVVAVGVGACIVAVVTTLRAPLLTALRRE